AVATQIFAAVYPAVLRDNGFPQLIATVTPLQEDIVGNVRRLLVVLLAAVGVLLLIACADIACLMLTRAAARGREMAIRTALGAARGRLMRLVLIETGVLALLGGTLGLALAWWAQKALIAAAPLAVPRASEIPVDGRVLAFTFAASAGAGVGGGPPPPAPAPPPR